MADFSFLTQASGHSGISIPNAKSRCLVALRSAVRWQRECFQEIRGLRGGYAPIGAVDPRDSGSKAGPIARLNCRALPVMENRPTTENEIRNPDAGGQEITPAGGYA